MHSFPHGRRQATQNPQGRGIALCQKHCSLHIIQSSSTHNLKLKPAVVLRWKCIIVDITSWHEFSHAEKPTWYHSTVWWHGFLSDIFFIFPKHVVVTGAYYFTSTVFFFPLGNTEWQLEDKRVRKNVGQSLGQSIFPGDSQSLQMIDHELAAAVTQHWPSLYHFCFTATN